MLLLFSIAGAAALAVFAFHQLRTRSPEAASAATTTVRELAAVVLICTRAVESVLDALAPGPRARVAGPAGYGRPLVDAWDEDE